MSIKQSYGHCVAPANTCTTLTIWVDIVWLFAAQIRRRCLQVHYTEFKHSLRLLIGCFMTHCFCSMNPKEISAFLEQNTISVDSMRSLVSEVMVISEE